MKKSVFTLLAIATMVVSMSSCSQNDGGSSNDLNLKQSSTTTTTTAYSDSQNNTDQYVMSFDLISQDLGTDGKVVEKKINLTTSNMTVTESFARGAFTDKYNAMLPDMQNQVNATGGKINMNNAKIVCTLKNSKGQIVMQQVVNPNK